MRTDPSVYLHRQVSKPALLFGVVAVIWILTLYAGNGDWIALLVGALVVLLIVVFHALTIRVDGEAISWWFGPGVFRRSIPLAVIADAAAVRNRWWYGWGIRYTSHGWLYNVDGLDAVEIVRRDGKTFRLGTDEPAALASAVLARLET